MNATLRYHPSREQLALVGELEGTLAAALPIARLREGSQAGNDWRSLDELGLLTAGVDTANGGSALSFAEQALIAIALGRQLVSPAVVATMAVLPAAMRRDGVSAGMRINVAFGDGRPVWVDDPEGGLLLLAVDDGATLHAIPDQGHIVDDETWGARLVGGELGRPAHRLSGDEMLPLRLLLAATLAGIAEATLASASEYARIREQFGRPIGSFQAVKHHCADMAIAARGARDLTAFAAVAIDTGRADARHAVESAFLVSAEAAIGNAGVNIQIHGGIGFSAEAEPHLFLKRAHLLAAAGGGLEEALARVAAAVEPGLAA